MVNIGSKCIDLSGNYDFDLHLLQSGYSLGYSLVKYSLVNILTMALH